MSVDWRWEARCGNQPRDEIFFGGNSLVAKAFCLGCPVKRECLADAMAWEARTGFRHGVWAGTTPAERTELAKTFFDRTGQKVPPTQPNR